MLKSVGKLHDKSFKKKFNDCIIQLNSMLVANGINLKQKLLLSNLLEDFRPQPMLDSENSSNVEVKNMWGQKDLQTILKERNDRIYNLENELEDLRSLNSKLSEERKRIKIDALNTSNSEGLEKILEAKKKELQEVTSELEGYKSKIKEIECQQQIYKENNELLKDSNKRLSEISNRKSPAQANRNFLLEIQKTFDSEQELSRLKGLTAELEIAQAGTVEKNKELENRIEVLTLMIADYENKVKLCGNKASYNNCNDNEAAILEELENVTIAFDQITATNKSLEERLSKALKGLSESQLETAQLKSKIKILEDSKQYIEREKRRLNEWKDNLLNETKAFDEKLDILDTQTGEKDKKINEYKLLLTTLQTNNKMLENETNTIGNAFRTAQSELLLLKNETKALQIELEDTKRISNAYKSLCTADTDLVEELERYKKVLRCSLCNIKIKNSVITKCMHTFCDNCLGERLKARQRKCPNCQIEFNSNDIKRVYF